MNLEENYLNQIIVIGDKVLIRPTTPMEKTTSGLFLPPTVIEKEKVQQGYVVKTGPGYAIPIPMENEDWKPKEEQIQYIPLQVREGDLAIFLVNSAIEVQLNGEKYYIVPQHAILMVERKDFF
jgi:co-chaperonin GroES (HSP10)